MAQSSFTFTGGVQSFVVPAGVTTMTVECYGAQGGGGNGGLGGYAKSVVPVTPGETLSIYVGGQPTGTAAGYNGGGAGGSYGDGGGGATDVRRGGTALANRVCVGAGGGGRSYTNAAGGAGGGLTGSPGDPGSNLAGQGGTQAAGGSGSASNGLAGSSAGIAGGLGFGGGSNIAKTGNSDGGGGGGGYYGGGSGSYQGTSSGGTSPGYGTGGGGGSSLATGTGSTTTAGQRTGSGAAVLTYNRAPSNPGTPTQPTAGQVVNTTATIAWGASTDPDGDAVRYEVDYTRDNGATWVRIVSDLDALSYVFDWTNVAASTAARVRVRARDLSFAYSSWVEGPTFEVRHNQAPTAPTNLTPANGTVLDRAATNVLAWTFTDPDGGDTQSKYDLDYRIVGAATWTTVSATSNVSSRSFPGGSLAAGNYEWRVRTYDPLNAVSPYSSVATFTAADRPTGPTLTNPTNGATISTPTGLVEWSFPTQEAYRVRKLADAAGSPDTATVLFDTGDVLNTSARSVAVTYPVNGRAEHVQVSVRSGGLWSAYSSARIVVSYTPPAVPTVVVAPDAVSGAIGLLVSHPTPTGSQPAVTSREVWRRETGKPATEVRLSTTAGTAFTDYRVASAVDYEYRVVAVGANGTQTTSAWAS